MYQAVCDSCRSMLTVATASGPAQCARCGHVFDTAHGIMLASMAAPPLPSYAPPRQQYQKPQRQRGGAAPVLSFIVPGLGQMYRGNVLSGLLWFFAVGLGYICFIVPGLVLHVLCIFNANNS